MHAPEPWSIVALDDDYCVIYAQGCRLDGRLPLRDAERIVACVNACRGIPTEVLVAATKEGGFDCRCGLQALAGHSGYLVSDPHDD